MSARTAGTLIASALVVAIVGSVLLVRRPAPAVLPGPPNPWADPSPAPAAAPAAEVPALPPPAKAAPPSRARSAFDRVLAALRSGDRAKVREALEDLRKELVPPAVPEAGNAAPIYRKAFQLYPEGMNDEETGLFERLGEGGALTADERSRLEAVLDRSREARKLLHEAGGRPGCNFDLDYAQGPAMLMDHITGFIRSARLLALESLMVEGPAVTETARASFRLSEAMADEPVLISQIVRTLCHEIASDSRQREFEGEVSADRLRSLVASLDPGSVRGGYEKTLLFELYSVTKLILDGGDPKMLREVGPPQLRLDDPKTSNDLAYFAETLSEYSALVGRPYYEVHDRLQQLDAARLQGAPAWAEITKLVMPAISRVSDRQARTEATLGTAQVAAALRLYRDAQGAYPATLDDLRGILPGAPVDPFTGKAYLYRREGQGFVVYSVGSDGQDGGGVSSDNDVLFKSPR